MANELRIGLDIHGEKKVESGLKGVGDQAEKTGDQLEDMGGQATDAAKASDKAGDSFKDTGRDAEFLTGKIEELSAAHQDLLRQLNATGDTSLEKDIRAAKRDLNKFKRFAEDLTPEVTPAAAEGGTLFGESFVNFASKAIASGNPYVTGAIIGIGVSSAPLLGGIIASAVLGGVGAGGIIGGVALAADDPRVQAAGEAVGDKLLGDLRTAADPFVDPLLASLNKVGNADFAAKLEPTFEALSETIAPLTDGALKLVDNILPGITAAARGAGPVFTELGVQLPEIGEAVSDMFTLIASDPDGAVKAVQTLANTIEVTVRGTGYLVAGLSQVYEKVIILDDILGTDERRQLIPRGATEGVKDFGDAADDAAEEVGDLKNAISELLGEAFGLEEAQDRAAGAVADLAEQIKKQHEEGMKGAGSLIGQTEAARDNRDAIRNLADDYGNLIVEYTEAGKSTKDLRAEFVKAAVQAGLNKKEVEKYADELFDLPKSVTTVLELKAKYSQAVAAIIGGAAAAGEHRDAGGPFSAGRAYVVGESGPEVAIFGANGTMRNHSDTMSMLSGASGGSAGPAGLSFAATVRQPDSALGQALAAFLVPYIQIEVINQGGDVVAVLGPGG